MTTLTYSTTAVKQLKKIPIIEKKKILRKLEQLQSNPLAGKRLQGELDDLYSLRAWPYRILYEILPGEIYVHSIAHRQSVYN